MKRTLTTLLVGILVGSTGLAAASSTGIAWSHKQNGYWCKSQGQTVLCVPTSGEGYGIGFDRRFVFVMHLDTEKVVFKRMQPSPYASVYRAGQ